MPDFSHPMNGQRANRPCVFCGRQPREDEYYGEGEQAWDAGASICPECWTETFPEVDEPIGKCVNCGGLVYEGDSNLAYACCPQCEDEIYSSLMELL